MQNSVSYFVKFLSYFRMISGHVLATLVNVSQADYSFSTKIVQKRKISLIILRPSKMVSFSPIDSMGNSCRTRFRILSKFPTRFRSRQCEMSLSLFCVSQ